MLKNFGLASTAVVLFLAAGSLAHAETIINVLDRSQVERLETMHAADVTTPQAKKISENFARVMRQTQHPGPVELRIVKGAGLAEAMQGRIVAVHESVGDLPETVQLFILAHELGHIALTHWSKMGMLFQKWVPGEVVKQKTDAVSAELGRDASALAYRMEFEADAFALNALRAMGYTLDDVTGVFACLGLYRDSATHPGSFKRMMTLRSLWHQEAPLPSS